VPVSVCLSGLLCNILSCLRVPSPAVTTCYGDGDFLVRVTCLHACLAAPPTVSDLGASLPCLATCLSFYSPSFCLLPAFAFVAAIAFFHSCG
jgi:hypothetical protein